MRTTLQRLGVVMVLVVGSLLGVAAVPAQAAVRQIDGPAYVSPSPGVPCPAPPKAFSDFTDFAPLVLRGSLIGCWYTKIDSFRSRPSGVYLERGREVFVGRLRGGRAGTFTTTYRFEGKFTPDGAEVHGRCQHPLVPGSGTGGFAGVTGRVDFKDLIATPVTYVYRGHLSFR